MNKPKNSFRVVAILCSLVLLLSSVNLNIITLADTDAPTVTYYEDEGGYGTAKLTADEVAYGQNVIKGQTPYAERVNGADRAISDYNAISYAKITDGIMDGHYDFLASDSAGNDFDIVYKLNGTKKIEKFVYYGVRCYDWVADKALTGVYEVYASLSYSNLFDPESKIYDYDYTRDGKHKIQTATFNKEINANFVAVRIKNPISNEDNQYFGTRISEIAFLGRNADVQVSVIEPEFITSAITVDENDVNNRFVGAYIDVNLYKDGTHTEEWGSRSDAIVFKGFGAWDGSAGDCKAWGLLNDTTSTNSYWQVDISLSEAIDDPESFVYYAHDSKNLASRHYAVFMASNKDSLYDESNKVVELTVNDNSAKRLGDRIDLTESGKTLKNINYVGIRFYHAAYHNAGGCPIVHNNMLALYGGTPVVQQEGIESIQSLQEVDLTGDNYLEKGSYSGGFYVNGEKTNEFSWYGVINAGLNAWHDENSNACFTKGVPNNLTQKDSYWQLDVKLSGKVSDPEKIVFLAHDSRKDLMSQHYAVFASDSTSDLYNEENKIIEVTGSTSRLGDEIDLSKIDKDIKNVTCFGIRFYHRGYTNSFGCQGQHIYLFGVYGGTYAESKVEVRAYNSSNEYGGADQLARDTAEIGENLIIGKSPYSIRVNGSAPDKWISTALATDGKFDKHFDYGQYNGTDGTCDFIYKLDSNPDVIKKVEKFIIMGHKDDNGSWADQYLTGKYEVYAAVNYTELFNEENMIYDYDWERDGLSRLQAATFKTDIYARYVAVRIINPVSFCTNISYQCPRISEIAFLGKTANIADDEKVISDNMPLEVYYGDNAGNKTDISDSISLEEYKALFDGRTDTAVEFKTNGNRLDVIVNLLKDYKVTNILAKTASNKGYSVYAASKFSELWAESAKISDGVYSDSTGSVKARYVRFSFDISSREKLKLQDIEVKGLANPMIILSEHLGLSIDNATVSTFENPVGNKDENNINFVSNSFDRVFNGDYYQTPARLIQGGVDGESTLNALVKLSALQNITEYTIAFTPHLVRYQPTKINVYIGETYEDAMDFTRTPDKTFTGLPEVGKYTEEIKPTLARYIRIEFVENNYGKGTSNIYGDLDENFFAGKNMEFALSEIDVIGTPVVGMADEDGNLLSFEQDGVKWSILALDENDVPTDVYSSKLVSVATTAEQKKSLYNAPYYKIDGDKAYRVEFYDISGKKIEDIGGRYVKISFPITADKEWLVGNTSNNSSVKLYDISTDNNTITVEDTYSSSLGFCLLVLTDENDSYWNGVNDTPAPTPDPTPTPTPTPDSPSTPGNTTPSYNNGFVNDNTESEVTDETEREQQLVTVGTETKHSLISPGVPTYLIVLIVAESVLLAGCIAAILFVQFKKPKKFIK